MDRDNCDVSCDLVLSNYLKRKGIKVIMAKVAHNTNCILLRCLISNLFFFESTIPNIQSNLSYFDTLEIAHK